MVIWPLSAVSRPSPYRLLFLTVFWWVRGWSPDNISAAGVACVVLSVCHCLNAVVAMTFLHPGRGEVVKVYQRVCQHPVVFAGAILLYFWYFMMRIDSWVGEDSVQSNPRRGLNAITATYIALTIVSTIAAVVL